VQCVGDFQIEGDADAAVTELEVAEAGRMWLDDGHVLASCAQSKRSVDSSVSRQAGAVVKSHRQMLWHVGMSLLVVQWYQVVSYIAL